MTTKNDSEDRTQMYAAEIAEAEAQRKKMAAQIESDFGFEFREMHAAERSVMERMLKTYESMTDTEKHDLHAWEAKWVTGSGEFGSSDWPGWAAVHARLAH